MEENVRIAGIDYSLTSPALCVHIGKEWAYENCTFYYLTGNKRLEAVLPRITGLLHREYESPQERYNNLATWALTNLNKHDVTNVYLEGYAFSATGQVFQIAENTGVLKDRLWKGEWRYDIVPPTVIKKFATGKGNANKELIQESFMKETGVDIKALLGQTPKQWNPSSDIIDSYYICKYGFQQEN